VQHREHRARRHRPAEADGEVGELGRQGDDEREQRLVAQLVAERRADELVAGDGDLAAASASEVRISSTSCSEMSVVRTVMFSPSVSCTTAVGKPASSTADRASDTETSWLVANSTTRPPVNSTPKLKPRTSMPSTASTSTAAVMPR
jgi:hypothetical protein